MKRRQFLKAALAAASVSMVAASPGCLVAPATATESAELSVDDFKTFDEFVQASLRAIAKGLGHEYKRISREYADMAGYRRLISRHRSKKGTSQTLPTYGA